jgi:hypothetical protein
MPDPAAQMVSRREIGNLDTASDAHQRDDLMSAVGHRAEAPAREIDEKSIIVRAAWALVGEPSK